MKPITILKLILAIIIGAGLAYFWNFLRPEDTTEIIAGVGVIGALAAFVVLHFMGKGGG